jgi:hypothetical protein
LSFLSAAFLLALPLVAVPVAIHLYRGRQRDVIHWGAMQFLASAITKGRSMEKLEELILMALRLLAVAALIFALARPMVRGSWLGMGADRQVILVLDNSLSMSREAGGQSIGDRLQERALEVIDSLSAGDAVQVLLAVGSEWATAEDVAADGGGRRQLREIVEGVEPSLGAADLLGSLQAAVHLQSTGELVGRRIVVITDSQAGSWRTDAKAAWQQLAEARKAARFPIAIEVIDCSQAGGDLDNVAVTEITAVQALVRPGEAIELTAHVSNFGEIASGETSIEWLVGNKVVGETEVEALEPKGQTGVATTVRLEEAGVHYLAGRIKVRDQLPLDQSAGLVVEVAERIPVLFVHGGIDESLSVGPVELFSSALGYRDGEPGEWHSLFEPEVVAPAALAERPLTNYRAIVINGGADVQSEAIESLEEYVRGGGGLWLTLGEGIDRDSFTRNWYVDGDGLSPLPIESLEVIEDLDQVAATIHPPAREHIATAQLANTTQLDIDEARVRQRWQFGSRPASAPAVSVLLESGNGRPLVVENYVGQGRVLVQAFPLDLDWSDLPKLKAFVVMVQDWLSYITAPRTARYNLAPGNSILAAAPAEELGANAKVITPRGREMDLVPLESGSGSVFRFSQTAVPGLYRVRFIADGGVVQEVPYYVARDPRESDLTPLTDAERLGVLASADVAFAGEGATSAASVAAMAPREEPVWGALLVALVALLAGELLLANRLSRQRHGFAVNTN